MSSWFERAHNVIAEATAHLRDDHPLEERIDVVDAAYPFGERRHFPYKAWLKARRQYLTRFGYKPREPAGQLPLLSPLDRQRLKAQGRA